MNGRLQHRLAAALGLTAILLGSASCGDVTRMGRSPSILVIDSLEAASGAKPGEFGTPLLSDVQTYVKKTIDGKEQRVATIFNDIALAKFRIVLKDQGSPGTTSTPSPLNAVTLHRYHVEFVRADGAKLFGVDVPYPFDGGVTATISDSSDVGFEIVRHQAKEEAPLRGLVFSDTRRSLAPISTLAYVTFYGKDQAGNAVSATGTISVNFGDFADPE